MHADTKAYNAALAPGERKICQLLAKEIDRALPDAENKVWHAHPVWFLDGNPIVGYSKLKDGVRLLFWSGQSFAEKGLRKEGSFRAAEARYTAAGEVDVEKLRRWLAQARVVQWDYKNIVRRKGRLERLEVEAGTNWRERALARVRARILEAVPGVVEEVKWRKPSNPAGVPVWSSDGMICTGETNKSAVKLTFARGAELPDPKGLFNASLDGGTRRAIDLHEGDALDEKAFKTLVRTAAALNASTARGEGARAPASRAASRGDATAGHRIFRTSVASVYPHYVAKAERNGRTKAEVDRIICWLTGYSGKELERQLAEKADFETFFAEAPALHPNSALITGVVCGVRVEEVEDPLMRKLRQLDKLIDELARGRAMEKILRA